MATTYGGRPCVDPGRFYRECVEHRLPTDWWGKANHFRLPLGRGPGTGHILLRQSDLDAVGTSADQTLVFSGADRAHRVSLTRITLTNARCLSPGGPGQAEAVFLCRVADRRWHLAKIPVDDAYNVAAADGASYLTQTKNGGSAWTWQQVVDDLVTTLGLTTAQFVLPFTPDGTPENLTYWGMFAWDALCDVLDRVACAAKYDPTADTFEVVRLGSADAAADAAMNRLASAKLWDGYNLSPERAWRPEKVQVQFPRRPRPTDGSSPYYAADVTLAAAAGVVAGTYVQLKDDLTALGATGAPTNAAALATRAAERAADWLRKRESYERPLVRVYRDFDPGAPADVLGSTVGAVGYDDRAVWRTEVTAEPDGRLEAWSPLDHLPPWFPPDGGTGGGYNRVQEEGANLTQRQTINFIGAGMTAADDAPNTRTNVTLHVAGVSQTGVVDTNWQTFGGRKYFPDGAYVTHTASGTGVAMFTVEPTNPAAPSTDPGHVAPTATTLPNLEDFCSICLLQSTGYDYAHILQAQDPGLDPDFYGADIWLYPAPGPSYESADPRTYSGRVVAVGRYAAWYPDDGKVYTGLTGVITIHDENGTDQELTLCGGLVVGWSGSGPAALP